MQTCNVHGHAAPLASSGVDALDEVLGGVYWGDNVVFRTSKAEAAAPFVHAFATADVYRERIVVRFGNGDGDAPAWPGVRVETLPGDVDAAIARTLELGREVGATGLLLVEDLGRLAERVGVDEAARFFIRVCPSLLRIGAVATWVLGPGIGDETADSIRRVTQVVLRIDEPGRLIIVKAEARALDVVGTALDFTVDQAGLPAVGRIGDTARLGVALAAVRVQRGLSQAEIGRMAGVSPSAISQAERGQRGLAVGTLVRLATALGVPLDELVMGRPAPGYRIRGRTAPHRGGASRVALVDGGGADYRLYEFRLDPDAHGTPPTHPRGTELVLLGRGLLLITMTDGSTAVIREGEALIGAGVGIADWRNLDEDQAVGFWVLV